MAMMQGMNRVLNVFHTRPILFLLAITMLFSFANAQAEDALLDEAGLGAVLEEFLAGSDGFAAVDADTLESDLLNLLPATDSVFLPAGSLEPLTKSLMAVEMLEGRLQRARYQLALRLVRVEYDPNMYPESYVLVSVERYNLGPVVHAELVEELGADVVAPLEEFGVGPNVAWRFVMAPVQGHQALMMAAARKELTEDEVAQAECLYGECLSLTWEAGPPAWEQVHVQPFEELVPSLDLSVADWELLAPEALMAVVTAVAGFNPYLAEVSGPERLIAQAVVDLNLGQDSVISAVLRQGALLDDSLAAIWTMAHDFGFVEARAAFVAYECGRGEALFAEPGSYCP